MSTGTVLRVRAGMKPIATVPHALRTIDVATGRCGSGAPPALRRLRRARRRASWPRRWSRSCSPNAVLEKFGGDSVAETRRNLEAYLAAMPEALTTVVSDGRS